MKKHRNTADKYAPPASDLYLVYLLPICLHFDRLLRGPLLLDRSLKMTHPT